MRVLVEDRSHPGVSLRRTDLRVARIDVHEGGRPPPASIHGHAIHARDVDEEVGLREQRRRTAGARPVLDAPPAVDERPAVAESHPPEKVCGEAEPVLVRRPELTRRRVVGGSPVRRLLVEPDVVPERAAAEQVVRRLPRVAAERLADEVAGQNDTGHVTSLHVELRAFRV